MRVGRKAIASLSTVSTALCSAFFSWLPSSASSTATEVVTSTTKAAAGAASESSSAAPAAAARRRMSVASEGPAEHETQAERERDRLQWPVLDETPGLLHVRPHRAAELRELVAGIRGKVLRALGDAVEAILHRGGGTRGRVTHCVHAPIIHHVILPVSSWGATSMP